jgi:hypothetical protein
VTHPHAADDFAAIRARLEQLRRERARVLAGDDRDAAEQPDPKSGLLPAILRAIEEAGSP